MSAAKDPRVVARWLIRAWWVLVAVLGLALVAYLLWRIP